MSDFCNQLLSPEAGPLVQFIKYVLAGGMATVVDVSVFYLCAWKIFPGLKEDDPLVKLLKLKVKHVEEAVRSRRFVTNTIIAFMFSNFTAYIINIFFVFKAGKHAWYIELLLFYAVSGFAIGLAAFIGWFMIKKMHLSTTSSYIAKGVSALLINFACRKFIIFKG